MVTVLAEVDALSVLGYALSVVLPVVPAAVAYLLSRAVASAFFDEGSRVPRRTAIVAGAGVWLIGVWCLVVVDLVWQTAETCLPPAEVYSAGYCEFWD